MVRTYFLVGSVLVQGAVVVLGCTQLQHLYSKLLKLDLPLLPFVPGLLAALHVYAHCTSVAWYRLTRIHQPAMTKLGAPLASMNSATCMCV